MKPYKKILISIFAATLLGTFLTGCQRLPYKIDVEQGNVIDQKMLSQLRIGMSKMEVQQYLGSSLLADIFHQDRWDYVQYYKSGRTQKLQKGLVSLFFTNGLLSGVKADQLAQIDKEPIRYGKLADRRLEEDEVLREDILNPKKPQPQPQQPQQ
ncbi:MAG: hypothetical protein CSA45_02170 [Gammaproteobacteria bacterium]|nr:MAG: hypothetical protein CSA45_02170 [Gammaproteobacteria bacterium]